MILKRSLSAVLAVSMVLSTAGAQPSPGASGASNDAIDLILQATMSKSPVEARQLLARAKAKAEAEKLPADTVATIDQLIAQASSKLTLAGTSNPLGGSGPVSFTIDVNGKATSLPTDTAKPATSVAPSTPAVSSSATPSSATDDQYAVIARAIELNPDIHTIMREIGIGRIERDSSNLDQIIKANTNQTIDSADQSHNSIDAILGEAGKFIKMMRETGLIKDWSQVNKALKAKHESIPIDVLALQIVNNATTQSAVYGALKKLALTPNSKIFASAGVTAEAVATYSLNADLVLRLADLYDMNLTESEQDVAILMILPIGKLAFFAGKNLLPVKKTAERLGELYGEAKGNPNPKAMSSFFAAVFASPIMTGIAKRMGLGAKVEGAVAAAPAKPAEPAAANAAAVEPAPAGAVARLGEATAKVEAAAAEAETAAARVEGAAVAAGDVAEKVVKTPISWKAQAGWLLAHTLISGVDTYLTGRAAMWMFGREKQKVRDTETADFHAFLMQDKAKGFFKLLIATLNAGSKLPAVYNVKKSKDDRRIDFVMNVARSIKICSPEDHDRFTKLKADGAYKATVQSAKNRINQTLGRTKGYADSDYRLLRFQCDSSLGFGRYNQIAKEFMTFNAIPEWEVAQLRLASYEERMQMGELLMQAQFLYEEPNDDQTQFFQTTISKILGLSRVDDVNYFSRLYGFIRSRGGMEQNVSSPTGWSIKTTSPDDPWALSANYTAPGGPDLPSPPPAAVAK